MFRFSVIHFRELALYKESDATGQTKSLHEKAAKKLETEIVKRPHHHSLISRSVYSSF